MSQINDCNMTISVPRYSLDNPLVAFTAYRENMKTPIRRRKITLKLCTSKNTICLQRIEQNRYIIWSTLAHLSESKKIVFVREINYIWNDVYSIGSARGKGERTNCHLLGTGTESGRNCAKENDYCKPRKNVKIVD